MYRLFILSLVTVLAVGAASALTLEEIERNWGATQNVRGTFTETYADGAQASGTLLVQNAGRMQMRYESGAVVTIADGLVRVDDPRGEPTTMSLGPLRRLFSSNPNLDGILVNTGSNNQVTSIQLHDPLNRVSGTVLVTFDNATGKLIQWRNRTNGDNIVTQFNY